MHKIVSFKEVHEELELESVFLTKRHDPVDFKHKYDDLNSMGFGNTISARIYLDISKNYHNIQKYQNKYIHKFILHSQLERVCEKYNLYVRPTELYMGDIPLKNLKEIQEFEVDIYDMSLWNRTINSSFETAFNQAFSEINLQRGNSMLSFKKILSMTDLQSRKNLLGIFNERIQIAAVKNVFNEKAFEKSSARIINSNEIEPKSQVDLDPIVLFTLPDGYLIMTAWGDESNDELVVNQKLN